MSNELKWCKSSYSGPDGGNCVEVAVGWRTSSYSGSGGGNCVEVAGCPAADVHVRDSKNLGGPQLAVPAAAWAAFVGFAADRTAQMMYVR
jgi:uncharacterized protein DUF397